MIKERLTMPARQVAGELPVVIPVHDEALERLVRQQETETRPRVPERSELDLQRRPPYGYD